MDPKTCLYQETHEWAAIAEEGGEKVATVGITDFAVHELTDIVFMELPSVGTQVTAGEEFGEVESVKAVSPLYSPVTGEVIAVNDALPKSPETLSEDPFGQGWMIRVKLTASVPADRLMDHEAYKKQCDGAA